MKICLISEYFYPDSTGGTGTVLSNLVRHLRDNYDDVEIDVVTGNKSYRGESGDLGAHQDWDGVQIRRLDTPRAHATSIKKRLLTNLKFSLATLRELLGRGRYDLVLVSTAPPVLPLAAKAFKALTGTPYAYIVYDLYPDIAVALDVLTPGSRPARVLQRLQKGWLHAASKTIVLGRCMADHLERTYALARPKIAVIPVGADCAQVVPQSSATRFRARHGLQGFVVLWAGNFGHHQNFDAILDAAALLQNSPAGAGNIGNAGDADIPAISFAFVGDGAKRDHIAARIRDEGLTNVRMFPFVPTEEFCDLLASADVSLVALEPGAEGLGVPSKFYNILASGRAAVALVAPDSEVARVLEEHGCGVRVEQNGAELAGVLAELANCPETVAGMGQNARRACQEQFSMEAIGRQFHQVLCEVARPAQKARAARRRRAIGHQTGTKTGRELPHNHGFERSLGKSKSGA